MSVAVNYRIIADNLDRSLQITANQATVKLETNHYLENIGSIGSIDDFLDDTRLFRYAMTAFGLADLAYAKGYMRRILEEGITDRNSLANRSTDQRLREFATAFDFAGLGSTTTGRAVTRQGTVDLYVRQSLEADAGRRDEGVRLALYFERKAAEIDSPFDFLADPALAKFARVVLGLPDAFAAVDIDRQAEVLAERIDIERLGDPDFARGLTDQFTALWDVNENPVANPVLSLFGVGGPAPVATLELAMSLRNFRLGGA